MQGNRFEGTFLCGRSEIQTESQRETIFFLKGIRWPLVGPAYVINVRRNSQICFLIFNFSAAAKQQFRFGLCFEEEAVLPFLISLLISLLAPR
jgi:hypothetical protein